MSKIGDVKKQMATVLVGKEATTELLLTALLADGHVLVEDVPGTGKTVMAKTLAATLDASFARVQFTPDLLPSDITGLHTYQPQNGSFVLRKGPIFAQVILADEINRATPRTQAALLECMEEHQVTLDGETLPLEEPFFVIATQNPIENAGTFPLPEAQLDRFAMRLSMGKLTVEEELAMVERFDRNRPLETVEPVMTAAELRELREQARQVYIHPALQKYMVELCQATRQTKRVLAGASPRATLCLAACAKAYAFLQERTYVVPEDIQALAVAVLAHRLVLSAEARREGGATAIMRQVLASVAVPTEEWSR